MAARATFALKAGVWFRRGRLDMVSPDSQAIACPLSGRNSTYRPVQISGAGSWSRTYALCSLFTSPLRIVAALTDGQFQPLANTVRFILWLQFICAQGPTLRDPIK